MLQKEQFMNVGAAVVTSNLAQAKFYKKQVCSTKDIVTAVTIRKTTFCMFTNTFSLSQSSEIKQFFISIIIHLFKEC